MLVVVETRESGVPGWKSTALPLRPSTSGAKMDRFLIIHGGVLQDVRLWSASLRRDGVQQLLPTDDELSPPGSHKMLMESNTSLKLLKARLMQVSHVHLLLEVLAVRNLVLSKWTSIS